MAAESTRLSSTVQKLARDFSLEQGGLRMSEQKYRSWQLTLRKLSAAERPTHAAEILALAMRFEREGGKNASYGAAQLYLLAGELLTGSAKAAWGAGRGKRK